MVSELVDIPFKKIEELLLERKINDNYLKKFIFSFISTKIFLDNCF